MITTGKLDNLGRVHLSQKEMSELGYKDGDLLYAEITANGLRISKDEKNNTYQCRVWLVGVHIGLDIMRSLGFISEENSFTETITGKQTLYAHITVPDDNGGAKNIPVHGEEEDFTGETTYYHVQYEIDFAEKSITIPLTAEQTQLPIRVIRKIDEQGRIHIPLKMRKDKPTPLWFVIDDKRISVEEVNELGLITIPKESHDLDINAGDEFELKESEDCIILQRTING